MDWEYRILNDRNLISVRASGQFSISAFEDMIKDMQSDRKWRPNMDSLIDFSFLDFSATTADNIRMAAEIHKRYDYRICRGRIAVIFGRESDFGLGRMYETFLESAVLATVRSFRNADEARHWIAENDSPPFDTEK